MKKNKDLTNEEIKQLEQGPTKDIHPYNKGGIFARIPFMVKALLMKWWAYGAGIFFIFWGTTNLLTGGERVPNLGEVFILLVLLALFNGIVSDCIIFHFIDLIDDDTNKTRKVVFFHNKKLYSLFINILYSMVVTLVAYNLFNLVVTLLVMLIPDLTLGVEPIFTGFLFLIVDIFFVFIKNMIIKIIKKIKGDEKNV